MKEVIQFSKDTLEKINKARMEGLYHEVSPAVFALLLYMHSWEKWVLSLSTFNDLRMKQTPIAVT